MNYAVRISMLAATLALGGCATTNPKDPFEPYNRAMFKFNDTVDQVALKPAAKAYREVLPSFVQTGVGNFFGNLGDVWTAANNLLQGKFADGLSDVMRVAVNSTFGLGGILDIGSEAGLIKHKEDFGQTLGKWGVQSGPYVVLPILGASTVRDTFATPVDFAGDIWTYKRPIRWRNTGTAVNLVDRRAAALDASRLIEEAALDRYEFIRDGYMQRRENNVRDGDTPKSSYEEYEEPKNALQDSPASEDATVKKDLPKTNIAEPKTVEPGGELPVELERNQTISTDATTTDATVAVSGKRQN